MSEFVEKYHKAYDAERRYRDAPRKGWADPKGRKSADNQTIEVRRKEAVDLAVMLSSALYSSQVLLRERIALVNYMDQLAEGELDMMTCGTCHNRYRSGWLDGACPYCAASVGAVEQVQEMLEEAKKIRPETGAAGQFARRTEGYCGRPLTEEAWAELERRINGG